MIFPYVVPTVVAVILWKWLLNSQFGLINYMLEDAGITNGPISWMGRDWIMVSLILVSVWQFFPFVVIGVLARLQTIPNELYEAATVDGAGAWQRFWYVTLPQLKNILFVIVLLRSIWMFTKFDTPWLMIQGGGAETYIRTLPVYTYMRTFAFYEAGKGAAMAMLMFLMLAGRERDLFPPLAAGGEPVNRARPPQRAQSADLSRGARAARVHDVPVPLDGLDRVQGFERDLRDAADPLAAHLHAREPRTAVRRNALSHLFPQQPEGRGL